MEQLLIVEDDIGLNQGLCKALKADARQIISCQDLKTAKEQLLCGGVSLILLDINLPDGSIVDAAQAKYTVDKNGVYNFSVRDYCGNILSYPVEVSNIDRLAPAADYEVMPGDWTNKPVTIRVTATDPEPEDGYAPSGVQSITMPDGTVVEGGTADFVAEANGKYDFIITDNGGNTFTCIPR